MAAPKVKRNEDIDRDPSGDIKVPDVPKDDWFEAVMMATALDDRKNGHGHPLCPWCGSDHILGTDGDPRPLIEHVKGMHMERLTAYMLNTDLGLEAFETLLEQKRRLDAITVTPDGRIGITDELSGPDYLYVPKEIREQAKREGGELRWARPDMVHRYKDQGGKPVQRPKDAKMPHQHSTEDTTTRANEMVLVYFPPQVRETRQRIRRNAAQAQLDSLSDTQSDFKTREQSDVGEIAYQYFRERGFTRADALKHAERAEKGAYQGFTRAAEERRNERTGMRQVHQR